MKLLLLLITLSNCYYASSQVQNRDEFSLIFKALRSYNVSTGQETDNLQSSEWVFYKNKTESFEVTFLEKKLVLNQKSSVKNLIDENTGEAFGRTFLEDKDGNVYIMDYYNENSNEIILFKNVKDDLSFEILYHFYGAK